MTEEVYEKRSETIEPQQEELEQKWDLLEAHDKFQRNGRIEEISGFCIRHNCKKKIGRSGHYP